jgi:hypothetical protein
MHQVDAVAMAVTVDCDQDREPVVAILTIPVEPPCSKPIDFNVTQLACDLDFIDFDALAFAIESVSVWPESPLNVGLLISANFFAQPTERTMKICGARVGEVSQDFADEILMQLARLTAHDWPPEVFPLGGWPKGFCGGVFQERKRNP